MELKYIKRMRQIYEHLSISEDNPVELSGAFTASLYILREIKSSHPKAENISAVISSAAFCRNASQYTFPLSFRDCKDKDFVLNITELCKIIAHEKPEHIFREFYTSFLPFYVHDWRPFERLIRFRPYEAAIIIHMLLIHMPNELDGEIILDPVLEEKLTELAGIDAYDMSDMINAFRLTEIPAENRLQIRGAVDAVVSFAQKHKIPCKVLLRDYSRLLQYITGARDRYKPEEMKAAAEFAVSNFVFSDEMKLNREQLAEYKKLLANLYKADDVIEVAHCAYSRMGYGSGLFEASFCLQEVFAQAPTGGEILLVNPSPYFVYRLSKLLPAATDSSASDSYSFRLTVCIEDEDWKRMYQLRKLKIRNCNYATFDSILATEQEYDLVFFAAGDLPVNMMRRFLRCKTDGKVVAYVPYTQYFGKAAENLPNLFSEAGIALTRIVDIPTAFSDTLPKKKALVYGTKTNTRTVDTVLLYHGFAFPGRIFAISHEVLPVPEEELRQGKTIAQIRESYQSHTPEEKKRSRAKSYCLSKEIMLHYVETHRKARPVLKVYYRSLSPVRWGNQGKRQTSFYEVPVHGTGVLAVERALRTLPFDERFTQTIIADLEQYFSGKREIPTTKTAWYMARPRLMNLSEYDDAYVREKLILDRDFSSFLDRPVDRFEIEEMESKIEAYGRHAREQLILVFNTFRRIGWIQKIPFLVRKNTSASDSAAVNSILRNLRNATFTEEQENKIMDRFFGYSKSVPGEFAFAFDSSVLGTAIRMFTGMSAREVCALQWKHFVPVEDLGFSQLIINRVLSPSGKTIVNAPYRDKYTHRKIPCCSLLERMLRRRKEYLMERYGFTEEGLTNEPIILKSEYRRDRMTGEICPPERVNQTSRAILAHAAFERKDIWIMDQEEPYTVDLSRYMGDRFRANLSLKAIFACLLTEGEFFHIAGLKPFRTLDRHYIDYNDPVMQEMIKQKLDRWTLKYLWKYFNEKPGVSYCQIEGTTVENGHIISNAYFDYLAELITEEGNEWNTKTNC